jgi:uncharacterized membrane protein YfcA
VIFITDPFFYLCAIPAVLIFGIAKGGFGGSIAVVSVPLMSLAISPVKAAAILLPVLIVMDAIALWSFRGKWHKQNLMILLPSAMIGIAIGAVYFRYLSDDAVRLLIAIIAIAFTLNFLIKRGKTTTTQPSIVKGSLWGAISGFTSFGIHAGGPPATMYLLPQNLEKSILMGTMAVFFSAVNLAKVVPYAMLGQLDTANLATSLVLMPLAPIGVRLGYYLHNKVSQAFIINFCYLFLGVVGMKLFYDGISGIMAG